MEDAMTRFSLTLSPQTEITGTIIRWDVPKLLENPPLIEITGYASIDQQYRRALKGIWQNAA
jgi:hypothetical protein